MWQYFHSVGLKRANQVLGLSAAPDLDKIKASRPSILMVTGIAGPRLYKKHLRGISTRITEMSFPDHHAFSEKDIQRISRAFNEL